jgi:hypothetical protein
MEKSQKNVLYEEETFLLTILLTFLVYLPLKLKFVAKAMIKIST